MGAVIKLLIGAILMAAAVWWIVQGSSQLIGRDALTDLVAFVNGAIPLGIFVDAPLIHFVHDVDIDLVLFQQNITTFC